MPDPSNPNLIPVHNPENEMKHKTLTKYEEKDLQISDPERRAMRKSFVGPLKGEINATSGKIDYLTPTVGSSTLNAQIPNAPYTTLYIQYFIHFILFCHSFLFLFNFMKIPLVLLEKGNFTKRQLSQ